MGRLVDLTGARFGRLTVIRRSDKVDKWGSVYWVCRCKCGRIKDIVGKRLSYGGSKSCGCLSGIVARKRQTTHGHTGYGKTSREYSKWSSMHQRCSNPKLKTYKIYGGRGIKVCKRWFEFTNFIADMGTCPKGYSLERINSNKNYTPKNCKWATLTEQARNTRRCVWVRLYGKRMILIDALRKLGIKHTGTLYRYKKRYNMTLVEALNFIIDKRK